MGTKRGGWPGGVDTGGERVNLPRRRVVFAAMRAALPLETTVETLGRGLSHEVISVTLVGSRGKLCGRSMERWGESGEQGEGLPNVRRSCGTSRGPKKRRAGAGRDCRFSRG